MEVKTIEIRDRGTLIVALAFRMRSSNIKDTNLLSRAGFPSDAYQVELVDAYSGVGHHDPFCWRSNGSSRTMFEAHLWIQTHFDEINSGDVVDVRFIKGEVNSPATSEVN